MIPKVASHILHHTSRAAAAVQAQTTQSIRNALQFQSGQPSAANTLNPWASTPGSSSSGWGSAGNAKQNAGRKFYSHTQSGDGLVGQTTNSASTHGSGASDELEDTKRIIVLRRQPAGHATVTVPSVRGPKRPRSSSHSSALSPKLSVLDAVQIYARHKHTFAAAAAPQAIEPAPAQRTFVRRNSTSSASVGSAEDRLDEPAPRETLATATATSDSAAFDSDIDSASHAASQASADASTAATEPDQDSQSDGLDLPKGKYDPVLMQEFKAALLARNAKRVDALIKQFRESGPLDIAFYNMALRAAIVVRQPGHALQPFIGVYNEMLANSVRPDEATYRILILAFCDRDFEVARMLEAVRARERRRELAHESATSNREQDAQLEARLQKEERIHFQSASELFNLVAPRYWKLGSAVYTALLRSCSVHADVDQAIKIYAHLEQYSKKSGIPPSAYYHLLGVYQRAKDIQGAQEVFSEFTKAAKEGKVFWHGAPDARKAHIRLYNRMLATYMGAGQPDKAIGLLEQMMDQNGGAEFTHADIPPPNARSFTELIHGFVENGDLDSALAWHGKLLQQEAAPLDDSEMPIVTPKRPDAVMWDIVIQACAAAGIPALDKLNALWLQFCEVATKDGIDARGMEKQMVLTANLHAINAVEPTSARAQTLLDFVIHRVLPVEVSLPSSFTLMGYIALRDQVRSLSTLLLQAGRPYDALSVAEFLVESEMDKVKVCQARGVAPADAVAQHGRALRMFVQQFTEMVVKLAGDTLPLRAAVQLAVLRFTVSLAMRHDVTITVLRAYAAEADGERSQLDTREWDMVIQAVVQFHEWKDAPKGLTRSIPEPDFKRILSDLAAQKIDPRGLHSRKRLVWVLVEKLGAEATDQLLRDTLGDTPEARVLSNLVTHTANLSSFIANEDVPMMDPQQVPPNLRIDTYHSRIVDEYYPSHPTLTPLDGYKRFEQGVQNNIYPTPEAIARLIGALGRLGHMDKVATLYNAAQAVLSSLEATDKQWQSLGWYHVEDQMIVAFAHSGDLAGAQVHRQRILKYRGVPSADAYGALISATKDTTDDVAPALALWEESQTLGVRPHIFLYNTIISKLAKARKVDHALALFQKMKAHGIRPSSVTFGAMISACARVGDAISAEHLFAEMASMNNYRPRIPPFNTLMQLYTYTKADRSRVLWFYEQMVAAGISPNGHTYKLLMDAYGMIEPVDFEALENVFELLCQDKSVGVAGSHWASLINAYGCTAKDLDRAIAVFESVQMHPSSLRSPRVMPDAVVYEALINVLVTQRRTDLVLPYIERLKQSGIHMTAYIANLLIKGHAASGDIDAARALFESLVDPAQGVAAPNNHIPHGSENASAPPPDAPVYREPSTWEAMVRAELGYGDPTRVDMLLKRMEARRYPSGVINRIRAILLGNDAPELGTPITQLQASMQAQRVQGIPVYLGDPASPLSSTTPPPA